MHHTHLPSPQAHAHTQYFAEGEQNHYKLHIVSYFTFTLCLYTTSLSLLPYSFVMNVEVILFISLTSCMSTVKTLLVGAHSLLSLVKGCGLPPAHSSIQLEKLSPLATVQPGVQALQDKFERIFNSSILPMEELIIEMS